MTRARRAVWQSVGAVVVVGLVVTFGTTTVPDVIGDDTRTAMQRLDAAGLSDHPHVAGTGDTVVGVIPGVGTRVVRFSDVELVFGEGADG
ncbi:PASTA domain-containing protein [Cellulomonas soli]|uniref:PASTA domain-containing protein n=1 Tax=Cellulomonas soli TaxID=931535 RepID=UPI003F87D209